MIGNNSTVLKARWLTSIATFYLLCAFIVCLVTTGLVYAQVGQIDARLSQPTVALGESVTLTVLAKDATGELDLSSLGADFEVVGRSSSSEVNIINGERSEIRSWVIEIMPLAQGVYTLPSVRVGNLETPLLSLSVNPAPKGAQRELFLEVSVDNNSPYVQAQVLLTVKVFQAVTIVDGSLASPNISGADVIALDNNRVSDEVRDGRNYRVLERRYAVFPSQSGRLVVEPMVLSVSVPADPKAVQGFFAPRRKLVRRSDSLILNVQPRPRNVSTSWWLPAAELSLRERWEGDVQNVSVGTPITRRITVRAMGVNSTQMPDLELPTVDSLSIYADTDNVTTSQDELGITTVKETVWAYIPEWFSTLDGKAEIAVLPAKTLNVLPGTSAGAVAASTDRSASQTSPSVATDSTKKLKTPSLTNSTTTADTNSAVEATTSNPITIESADAASTKDAGDARQVDGEGTASSAMTMIARTLTDWRDNLFANRHAWRWLAMVALLGWGITAILLVFARRSGRNARRNGANELDINGFHRSTATGPTALVDMNSACQENDVRALQTAVLDWAASAWPNNPPAHFHELSSRLQALVPNDGSSTEQQVRALAAVERKLALLDATLYRPTPKGGLANNLTNGAQMGGDSVDARTSGSGGVGSNAVKIKPPDAVLAELKSLPASLQAFLEDQSRDISDRSHLPQL